MTVCDFPHKCLSRSVGGRGSGSKFLPLKLQHFLSVRVSQKGSTRSFFAKTACEFFMFFYVSYTEVGGVTIYFVGWLRDGGSMKQNTRYEFSRCLFEQM